MIEIAFIVVLTILAGAAWLGISLVMLDTGLDFGNPTDRADATRQLERERWSKRPKA